MDWLVRRLLKWGLGELDARVLLSELDEAYRNIAKTKGKAAAGAWQVKEILRAVFLSAAARFRRRTRPHPLEWVSRGLVIGEAVDNFLRDVRFGLRTLRRKPLFTAVSVGTLGLGIGASTAIFSVVEAVLLRPLPYREPGQLVQVWETFPDWIDNPQLSSGWDRIYLAWPDYQRWRDNQTFYQDVALYGASVMTLSGSGDPERIRVGTASASLLTVLGVNPVLGRDFLPGEDGREARHVALLSYEHWRERFGADQDVLGSSITLNGTPFSVVGVLPQGFRVRGLGIFGGAGDYQVWIPTGANSARLRVNDHSYDAVGRLKPGVTIEQAFAETESLLRGDRSPEEIGARLVYRDELEDAGLKRPLWLLLASSLVLLLIACGNTAVLLVGEFSGRQKEIATRMAVGASRRRIVLQLLTESVMLGLGGSVVGGALAILGTRLLIGLAPAIPRLEFVTVNGPVLMFGAFLGITSGIVFGMVSSWRVWRGRLGHSLQMARGEEKGQKSLFSLGIISSEVGLTLLLLVVAGLLVRSFLGLLTVEPGFDAPRLAQISVRLPTGQYAGSETRMGVFSEMAAALSAIPGVSAVSGTTSLPFLGYPSMVSFGIEGEAEPEGGSRHTSPKSVLPGFHETMGIPLLAGRTITAEDRAELASVAVVSETMARRFWPDRSPIGARVLFGDTLTVVGVVGDVRHESMDAEYLPTMYVPLALDPYLSITFAVRADVEPASLLHQLRTAVRTVEADAPVTRVSTMGSLINRSTRDARFRTVLMVMFGICATVLAGAGVFGVTARTVSFRLRELGIRLAMGAQAGELVKLSVGRAFVAGCVGIGLGMVAALWASSLFAGFLFEVETWDPLTYLLSTATLLGVCLLAGLLPARRAVKLDPVQVLREE